MFRSSASPAGSSPVFPAAGRRSRAIVFALWLATAAFLAAHHVMWRDEVRAYTLALSGDSVADMLGAVHGEGHPALWYLLIRGFHAVAPYPQAMPAAAFLVGAAAAAIFAFRAPFRWPVLALVLFGRFALYEYTVMARNYGITMLVLFAIAALYTRHRDKGWPLGLLLILLCNTNAPSVLLAAALLLFWAVDLLRTQPLGWTAPWRAWGLAAGMSLVGVAACFAEIYPPFNDAAAASLPTSPGLWLLAVAKMLPLAGEKFNEWLPIAPFAMRRHLRIVLLPILVFGALLRWLRAPAALIAGGAALLSLLAMFTFLYPGMYRHQALLFPFFAVLAWLIAEGHGGRPLPAGRRTLAAIRVGNALILLLLGLQLLQSAELVGRAARGMPESRSYELAQLLRRPALRRAIVIGDPDYNLEPLPYYIDNPTYFLRERRFGRYVLFSRHAKRVIRLGDVLDTAKALHRATGRPVVIAMSEPLFRAGVPAWHPRGFYGDVLQSAGDFHRFLSETRGLASFAPLDDGDESYDVFVYGLDSVR